MRENSEFFPKAYTKAEETENEIIKLLNMELDNRKITNYNFLPKEKKRNIDIRLLNTETCEKVCEIDVHETKFGPPNEEGYWPWPFHLPHGVDNRINPRRYKSYFEERGDFFLICADLRKHGAWDNGDFFMITPQIISKSTTENVKCKRKGFEGIEPMFFIEWKNLLDTWGIGKIIKYLKNSNFLS